MFKLVLLLLGVAGGAAATTSWLLSESDGDVTEVSLPGRLELLRARVRAAQAEGAIAAQETQNRVRHDLDTYRLHPDRPATSS